MRVEFPIRSWSEANARVHWATRARRAGEQRRVARICVRAALARSLAPPLPLTVTLTRLAPKRLDTDNLAISLKAVRDGVADALGLDDGDERLVWRYAQERLRPGHYGIRVEVS